MIYALNNLQFRFHINFSPSSATYRKHWLARTCLIIPEVFERLIRSAIMFLTIVWFSHIFQLWCFLLLLFFYLCDNRMALKATLILLPLLGVTWLLGFLQANSDSAVMSYAFVLLNSVQVITRVFSFKLWFTFCLLSNQFISWTIVHVK